MLQVNSVSTVCCYLSRTGQPLTSPGSGIISFPSVAQLAPSPERWSHPSANVEPAIFPTTPVTCPYTGVCPEIAQVLTKNWQNSGVSARVFAILPSAYSAGCEAGIDVLKRDTTASLMLSAKSTQGPTPGRLGGSHTPVPIAEAGPCNSRGW